MTTHPLLLALLAAVGMTCLATAQVSTSEQLAEEVLEAFQSRTDPRAPYVLAHRLLEEVPAHLEGRRIAARLALEMASPSLALDHVSFALARLGEDQADEPFLRLAALAHEVMGEPAAAWNSLERIEAADADQRAEIHRWQAQLLGQYYALPALDEIAARAKADLSDVAVSRLSSGNNYYGGFDIQDSGEVVLDACRTIGDITIYDSQLGTSSPAIRVTDSTLHVNGGFFVGGQGSKISSSAYDGGEALAANQSTVFLSKVQMYGGFGGGGNFQSPFTGPSGGAAVSCIDSTLHVRGGRGGLIRGGDGGIGGWSGTQHGPGGSGIILDSMSSLFTTPNVNIEGGIRSLGGQYEKVAIAVDSNGTWSQLPEDRSSFGLSTRTPSPGELVIAEYDGAPDSIAIGLVSYFQASPHILLGAAGPVLISSTSYMVLPTVTLDHSGFATNTLAVPGDSALIGETIFLQTLGWNVSGALSFSSPVMVAINS